MTPEIISLAKQFRISVLSTGKFAASDDLSNEEYLLEVLRAEQAAREERAIRERLKQARLPAFRHLRVLRNLIPISKKASQENSLTFWPSLSGLTASITSFSLGRPVPVRHTQPSLLATRLRVTVTMLLSTPWTVSCISSKPARYP